MLAQLLTFIQLQGRWKFQWMKDHPHLVVWMGIPISYLFMYSVQNMVEHFRKSHFFLSVAQHNQYDDDTVFNENNVVLYLAELEEYISLFITYMAYK